MDFVITTTTTTSTTVRLAPTPMPRPIHTFKLKPTPKPRQTKKKMSSEQSQLRLSDRHKALLDAGWGERAGAYANLQNVYSQIVDGKSIHAFPYTDIYSTIKFISGLKKYPSGISVNHKKQTLYIHNCKGQQIYCETNKETPTTKKHNWYTFYEL